MSHTPEQLEIAKRIATFMLREHQILILPGDYERFADALAYATQPPEGAIEVEIAVRCKDGYSRVVRYDATGDDMHASQIVGGETHRAIVRAWIPRVAPTPVVEGSVIK